MDLQTKTPAERYHVPRDAEPVSRPVADPAFIDNRPGAAALHGLSDAMHGSPRMAAQRALADTMQDSPRMTAQREALALMRRDGMHDMPWPGAPPLRPVPKSVQAGAKPAVQTKDGALPVQRQIEFEYDEQGKELEVNLSVTAKQLFAELVDQYGFRATHELQLILDEFDRGNAIFSDFPELIQVLADRDIVASSDLFSVNSGEEEEEEQEALPETFSFYHGTELKLAQKLAEGEKIDARGKGEFGGGFYMTHDPYQAAHIGDYYTAREKRGSSWGVIEFKIPTVALQGSLRNNKVITQDDFEDYYEQVQQIGNQKESPYDWTIGPIKDRKTPYIQHLFASGGLSVLNDKATIRKLVLSGKVGINKGAYLSKVEGYDPSFDEILNMLEEMAEGEEFEEEEEGEEEEESEVDYEYLEGRVKAALTANNNRLVDNVIEELKAALEVAPNDQMILGWLSQLI